MRPLPFVFRIALVLLAASLPAEAATISVSTPQKIQDAIDAASPGDTLVVAPGTYYEHIDFKGKNIVVTSTLSTDSATIEAARRSTIIDGSNTGPAVTSSVPPIDGPIITGFVGLLLSYFTIRHGGSPVPGGAPASYGGVYIPYGGPSLIGNIITNNNFGGVSVDIGGFGYLVSNTITENTCWGVVANGGSMRVDQNEITSTQTPATGCTLTNSLGTFSTNSSGVLFNGTSGRVEDGYAEIYGNTIEGNVQAPSTEAPIEGGAGIAVYAGIALIENNIIRNNSAPFARGGAIDIAHISGAFGTSVTAVIFQNLIYRNQAGCGGGAIAFDLASLNNGSSFYRTQNSYSLIVANNTIAGNSVLSSTSTGCSNDAAIYADDQGLASPEILFVNNVISGSASTPATDCHQQSVPSIYNQAVFDHNLLFNAGEAFFGSFCVDESATPLNSLFGNITADPQFVNPDVGNYHLQPSSPGIDAGNNGIGLTLDTEYFAEFSLSSPDLDRNTRVQNATGRLDGTGKAVDVIDIGAYERPGTVASASPITMTILNDGLPKDPGPGTLTAYISGGTTKPDNPPGALETIVPTGTVTFFIDGAQAADPVPIASIKSPLSGVPEFAGNLGVAYATINFTPGPHVLTATFQPAPKVDATQSVALVIQISNTPTALTLRANPYNTSIGNPVTFTVTAQRSKEGYVPSPISLLDVNTNQVLGTIMPDRTTGIGTFTTSTLPFGYTVAEAMFAGQGTYAGSSSNAVSVDITAPTALTIQSAQDPAMAFTPFNLSAQFTPLASAPPGGYITFTATSTVPGSYAEDIGRGTITAGTATRAVTLPAGMYEITANYAGNATHGASTSAAILETVQGLPTTLTLTSALNPALAFQTVALMAHLATSASVPAGGISGSVAFAANGKQIGTAVVDAAGDAVFDASFPAGTYTLTASYAGSSSLGASRSPAVTEVVNQDSTTITFVVNPSPGYFPRESEALTAVVTAVDSKTVPTGSVVFLDGLNGSQTALATVAVGANGQANLAVTTLVLGTHTLTAVYNGDTNYRGSTSALVTLEIILRDFKLAADPAITIQTEHHKSLGITLTSIGGFTDTVGLTCDNLPQFTTCNFPRGGRKGSVALSGEAPVATTVDIETDAIFGFTSGLMRDGVRTGVFFALLLPVALLSLRRGVRRRLRAARLFVAVFALAVASTLLGCSGHIPGHTPPGTYTITITGKGAATGTTHTANFMLVVTE